MMRYWRHAVVACVLATGCLKPPRTYPIPAAMPVGASFGRTWDAVIDRFAADNIPIKTIERVSGIIVAEPLLVSPEINPEYADCGTGSLMNPIARQASYNVRVSGDSTSSQVRVTATFGTGTYNRCTSTGAFEKHFMTAIKTAAEKK